MMDTNILLRKWILANASVTVLLGVPPNAGGGVYVGDLVKGFDPVNIGPGITITNVGGVTDPEMPIFDDRKQVRIWAGVEQGMLARQVYSAVRSLIHGKTNIAIPNTGYIMRCLEAVAGQDVTDPDTGWATVLGFFQLMAREL